MASRLVGGFGLPTEVVPGTYVPVTDRRKRAVCGETGGETGSSGFAGSFPRRVEAVPCDDAWLTPRRMKAVVGRVCIGGGESVSSLPDAMGGAAGNCGVRTCRAEATIGGMTDGADGLFSVVFGCKKGNGVRKAGLTVRVLLGSCVVAIGDLTRKDGILSVSGAVGVVWNGDGVRMGGGGIGSSGSG